MWPKVWALDLGMRLWQDSCCLLLRGRPTPSQVCALGLRLYKLGLRVIRDLSAHALCLQARCNLQESKIYPVLRRMMQLVTPGEYTNFKRQLKAREEGGWKRVDWSLVVEPRLRELELLHARLMSFNPKVSSSACKVRIELLNKT